METRVYAAPAVRLVEENAAARSLAMATLFAALTAIGALAAVRLPFTPVPFTLQVFFVLLTGAALGRRLGGLAQAEYLLFGAAGLHVFAGGAGGWAAFVGPSAGYLPGFVLGAWVVGLLVERMAHPSAPKLLAAMLAGLLAIYLPGVLWLSLWMHCSLWHAVLLGAVPFASLDAVKAAAAAGAAHRLLRV